MENYVTISQLKYQVSDPVMRKWAEKYGILDTCRLIQMCLSEGSGWLGGERIDQEFMDSLSEKDLKIYKKVIRYMEN